MSPPDPREVLRRHGLRPKRSWGQNFLVNLALVERIADEIAGAEVDLAVEIGAGLGTLTTALGERVPRVVAIERDPDLLRVLAAEKSQGRLGDAVEIVGADAARFDYHALCREAERAALVGNLPYQITGRLIRRVTEVREAIVLSLVMVQQEVADRLVARPGTPSYGVLSVMTQAYLDARVLWRVAPGSFHPRPKVASAVVRLEPSAAPRAGDVPEDRLARVVHAAFASRRKTLRNTLGALAGKTAACAALEAAGVAPGARAETLSVESLAAIARRLDR